MKRIVNSVVSVLVLITILLFPISNSVRAIQSQSGDSNESTEEQENAIAFLNYLCYISQDISDSTDNRLYLEDIYSKLINNTKPQNVDDRTKAQILDLLDVVERHRMIDVKRERLKYINEQNQSQAIKNAIPDPSTVLNVVLSSEDYYMLAFAVGSMALDSWKGYKDYISESEWEFFEANTMLDDEEAEEFHQRRRGMFSYMVDMCNTYSIDTSLNENQIQDFVSIKNEKNVTRRISQLESKKRIYESFGSYWLLLAESYYAEEEYQKCVDAISSYRSLNIGILRYDYDYANAMPKAMASMKKLYEDGVVSRAEYERYILTGCEDIENNIDVKDWSLRYFVAQSYVELFNISRNTQFIDKAYTLCSDTISFLVSEQKSLNEKYLNEVVEIDAPSNATKEEENEYKRYNKELKNNRKTELPPTYDPLLLFCDLLFAVSEKTDIDAKEKTRINRILHDNNEPLFLTKTLDGFYWFNDQGKTLNPDDMSIEYDDYTIEIPAAYLTQDSSIIVTVVSNGNTTIFDDWKIKKVNRGIEGEIDTFTAVYTSDNADSYKWEGGETISVVVQPHNSIDKTLTFNYSVSKTKDAWYEYLKFWEDTYVFERT
ncbi:hypothetical protein SAMN02910456_02634 [Ruminococcaceae bacterium YRB3002]|nr:hypothetical protein SAMN02910456_02634 [Ruminococcaceae bacterium YRB3002]